MKMVFLFISLFVYISSLSQTRCLQIHAENGAAVPYATLIVKKKNNVFTGDSAGSICSRFISSIENGDTLLISAIGYEELKTIYTGSDVFMLEQKSILLPEVMIINGEGELETWGTKRNPGPLGGFKCKHVFHEPLNSLGRIIYPDVNVRKAEIQSVAFYDETGKGIDLPVRLRIFLIGKDSLPTNDYLQENIFLSTKGKGWIEADLKGKGLVIPKEGLAIAVELFADSDEYFYKEKIRGADGKKEENRMYGFSLSREDDNGFLTLMKFSSRHRWIVERFDSRSCGNIVSRVKVKVWR